MLKRTLSLALASCWLSSLPSSASDLTQGQIDMGTLYGSPSNPDDLLEYTDRTYMDQLINNNASYTTSTSGGFLGIGATTTTTYSIEAWDATTGCLQGSNANNGDGSWAGTSGGNCANIGTNDEGAIRFGYRHTVVSQTQDIIDDALKIAGVHVVGYLWQWKVKNYNANDTSANQVNNQDPLYVRVIVKDNEGKVVDEREWDYSYSISGWQQKSGMHWYDPFLMGDEVDTLTLEVEGYDKGMWAGWWGPEFREAGIYSIFVYKEPIDCSDPLNDPTCPGYATALQEQQQAMLEEQLALAEMTNESASVEEVIEEPVIEEVIEEPQPEPVAEVVEDVAEEVLEEPMEVAGDVEGEISNDTAVGSGNSSRVRVNPLDVARGAVADAAAVAGNAVSGALSSASQSNEDTSSFVMNQASQSASQSASMDQQLTEDVQSAAAERNQENLLELDQTVASVEANVAAALQSVEEANQTSIQATDNLIEQALSSTIVNLEMQQEQIDATSDEKFLEMQLASLDIPENVLQVEVIVEDYSADVVNETLNNIINTLTNPSFELQVEEQEEELSEPLSAGEEADLVSKAFAGSDDEDARSALLGYNPLFSQYEQPQMADADFYKPKDIYPEQENYDNPNARFFNGASDEKHRAMVRQQYERN